MVDDVLVAPNIWTDGSREPIPHFDVEIAGAGAFVHSPAIIFDSNHWGHAQDLDDPHEGSSHIFSGVLGPIQSVQRAEFWGVILALQAYSGIHIGIDNLNVLRGVAALLSHDVPRSPLPLMKDGDLLTTIHSMLSLRGFDTVKVSKVKGHATRAMVDNGNVRLEDLVGNNGARPLSLKQNDVYTLVITSGCIDLHTAHTPHNGSGAELLLFSLIHDQRLVRTVQQHNAFACSKQFL